MKKTFVTTERLLEMVLDIDEMGKEATNWEADFLESMIPLLRENRFLTGKQIQKIKDTYQKYTEKDYRY